VVGAEVQESPVEEVMVTVMVTVTDMGELKVEQETLMGWEEVAGWGYLKAVNTEEKHD
jgi:hypothetical protein